jgi:hypothetical protein
MPPRRPAEIDITVLYENHEYKFPVPLGSSFGELVQFARQRYPEIPDMPAFAVYMCQDKRTTRIDTSEAFTASHRNQKFRIKNSTPAPPRRDANDFSVTVVIDGRIFRDFRLRRSMFVGEISNSVCAAERLPPPHPSPGVVLATRDWIETVLRDIDPLSSIDWPSLSERRIREVPVVRIRIDFNEIHNEEVILKSNDRISTMPCSLDLSLRGWRSPERGSAAYKVRIRPGADVLPPDLLVGSLRTTSDAALLIARMSKNQRHRMICFLEDVYTTEPVFIDSDPQTPISEVRLRSARKMR